MKQSEVCRQMIMMAFDPARAEFSITLADAMDLYRDLIMGETNTASIDEALSDAVSSPLDNLGSYLDAYEDRCAYTGSVVDTIKGRGSYEKKAIYQRLIDYRSKHGLGSLKTIADASNGLSETELRLMINGQKYPLIRWQMVGDALDKLEEKEESDDDK